MRFLLVILVSHILRGVFATAQTSADVQARPAETLLDQISREVHLQPTCASTLVIRYHRLLQLAQLVRGNKAINRPQLEAIRARAEAGEVDSACKDIDRALLDLCRVGQREPVFGRIRRVTFPSSTGATVVGYLVSPSSPSDRAFIFGHGGFGQKELWLDLMLAVADKVGAYALSMDFEGAGESTGFSTWNGRIADFSGAIDFLEREYGVRRFASGGHSGGGAWPAACAAVVEPRIRAVALWDCIFDFYDTHVGADALDPGGNPAPLLERTSRENRGRRIVPPQVASFRDIPNNLNSIYADIEATMGRFRQLPRQLGQAQAERPLAVLHIVAEDLIRPIGRPQVDAFKLASEPGASPLRARYHDRPLRFRVSGLFGDRYLTWEGNLLQPQRTLVIPNTTHGFEMPGRALGVEATVDWLTQNL